MKPARVSAFSFILFIGLFLLHPSTSMATCTPAGPEAPQQVIAKLCEKVDSCVGDDNNNASCNWTAMNQTVLWEKMGVSHPVGSAFEVQRNIRAGKISVNEGNLCRCVEKIPHFSCDQVMLHFSPANNFIHPENLIDSGECAQVFSVDSSNK